MAVERILISKEAVTALENLIIGMSNAVSVWAEETENLTSCMSSVRESVGPFSDMSGQVENAKEYINSLLASGSAGNP